MAFSLVFFFFIRPLPFSIVSRNKLTLHSATNPPEVSPLNSLPCPVSDESFQRPEFVRQKSPFLRSKVHAGVLCWATFSLPGSFMFAPQFITPKEWAVKIGSTHFLCSYRTKTHNPPTQTSPQNTHHSTANFPSRCCLHLKLYWHLPFCFFSFPSAF